MQNIKHAVIVAAGLGSRLGLNIPKCLLDIGGRKLLYYQIKLLEDVEDVRIVVGFMEENVIEYAKNIRRDIVFIRNPNYKTTTASYSLYLATKDLKDPFVTIDGDMIIQKGDFRAFLESIDGTESIIGVTSAKTEEAVFVSLNENRKITKFHRAPKTNLEWCGIAYLKDIKIHKDRQYVFEEIEPHLPLQTFEFNCYEIDTPDDLALAVAHFKEMRYD